MDTLPESEALPDMEDHPGTAELPDGFGDTIEWLRDDAGKAWQQQNFARTHGDRTGEGVLAQVKIIYDGDGGPDTIEGGTWSGFVHPDQCTLDRKKPGLLWEGRPWFPDSPPEGGLTLRKKTCAAGGAEVLTCSASSAGWTAKRDGSSTSGITSGRGGISLPSSPIRSLTGLA